ncbi:alpha/beta fold hydrolase [Clostridium cylindrosporum]|uniref:Alpha/beta hydrolase fold-containing protein n=1 Tax=Clostridium cylindrosporum DSM 605 TaxID=1121307 RepID=A0A0J8DGM5_CLOCY|nr:alpha/beta hydrolase [Clostridium cylindrosporum]KMT23338.1 alpha/beta hydrolase fold-containing protein [Clostridium cylindrosporum DSM 605]
MRISYEFNSFDEVVVKGYKWIEENVKPNLIVVISHGMAERIERYDEFARFLLSNNIFVYGHSHRGHGLTSKSKEELGYLGVDGWNRMREDLKYAIEMAKKDYPDAKIILLGHSMGSFLARDFIIENSKLIDGLILSGTGFYGNFKLRFGSIITRLITKRKGELYKSKIIDKLVFGNNNSKISSPKTKFDWISRSEKAVQEYLKDPYCGNIHPSSFFFEFFTNLQRLLYESSFEEKNNNLKIFILSGDKDPIGFYGKGVNKTIDFYKSHEFKVEFTLYTDGRHEMLHEINKEEVYNDLLKWIKNI